ncbi:adenylosuccinate synthetase, partial [mine drainage metagenome]
RLKRYVCDTSRAVSDAINAGERVLFEGAQGSLLDVDHGTYPYVTSSHPIAGGVTIGSGVGPTKISGVIGVIKAYTSRVGDGPFPTELKDSLGDAIRERGREYGTTTGRPRRIGWLDGVLLSYAARINGMTHIAINSMDVLSGRERVRVAVAYELDGKVI